MDDVLQLALNLVPKDSKLKALIEKEIETIIVSKDGELFAIFYGSSMTTGSGIERPNEIEILYLLLNYLLLKIQNRDESDKVENIFTISDEQRKKLKTIFEILKQWLVDLIVVDSIRKSSEQNEHIKNYALALQKRIENLQDICIVPSGFTKIRYFRSDCVNFLMLESQYNGPHSTACIIEPESSEYRRCFQIDPISPYHRSYRELTIDKISLGLEIKKIPSANFDINILLPLMTLRTITGSTYYESAHFYELFLSKLGGEGHLSNEKECFVNIEEKGFFSLSWTLVKNVFYYLFKKFFDSQEAHSLYAKIIYEFQFKLLISTFDKYTKLETTDRLNRLKHQFLLHEMCRKVAYHVINDQEMNKKTTIDFILKIQQSIEYNNEKLNDEKRNEKYIKAIKFQHKNFENILPENLKGLKFIQENITNNLSSSLNDTVRKQFSFHTINCGKDKIATTLIEFNRMLDEITKDYGFNRVIQICHTVENFVFSIAQPSGFKNWCNDEKSNDELARILVRIANLYYNCSAIITSQLHPDKNCTYDPTYYTKLVLILFSLFAMVEDLARNDKLIGLSLINYKISTEWKDLSLQSIIPQLALPERKWIDLINKLKVYFNLSTTNIEQTRAKETHLFHSSSCSLNDDSHENNTDVMYALNLLKNYFKDSYKIFEETLKSVKTNELRVKWYKLLCTDEYLPKVLTCLRDISCLCQLSLWGFSAVVIQKIISSSSSQATMYSRFTSRAYGCGYNQRVVFDLPIGLYFDHTRERIVDFTLPEEQNKYQRLISFDPKKKLESNVFENEIISTQNKKPDNLTRPQYYRLCSLQRDDALKFILLYIALKNNEINFETEEHCYLVKQALHKLGTYDKMCLLEQQFENKNFANALVNKFIEIILDLKERITQYKSIGHALDILLYLYDFCSDDIKILIEECLKKLRVVLLKYINDENNLPNQNDNQSLASILSWYYIRVLLSKYINKEKNLPNLNDNQILAPILSCYYILTHKNAKILDEKEVSEILRLRILIENNSKLKSLIPNSLYIKMMTNLFNLSSKIENIINNNFQILDAYIESSRGSWKKETNMNLYVKNVYSFVPLKGSLFKNGQPLAGLPNQILNHSFYKECFGEQNFLVDFTDRKVFKQTLRFYETKSKESVNIRLSLLSNNKLWIEDTNQTFVSRTYLSKLPKFLLENSTHSENGEVVFYSHWYENDKILIKNQDKIVRFEIDLTTNEIYSCEHQKFLIPFTKDGFDRSNVLYTIFSRFEDENYIVVLKSEKQDTKPVMISLPRLNLKFKIEGTKVISEDFKDYCLSQDQHINTLFGLSQYLIIEPDLQSDNPMKFNRKIIIPYHPIGEKESFFSNTIQFNLQKIGRPAYFSYEIDEDLECLNSETTAGSLYLALLYFKTATLDKDLFFKMNGYEICVHILKTCWQNCQYSDIEFNIILKFFEIKYSELERPWSAYVNSKLSIFSAATDGSYPHHRNTHAIFLRLIYLLSSSYQTEFLIKTDINKKNLYFYFLRENFVKYHFNFYLIFKDLIDKRCRLSLEEERELLSSCVEHYSQSRLADYYKSISGKKKLQLISNDPLDYKHLEMNFFSKSSFENLKFNKEMMTYFAKKFSSSYTSLNNKISNVKNLISDWINIKFDLTSFISFYQIALDIENLSDFNKPSFSYFLAYLYMKAGVCSDNYGDKVFIKILYIVSIFPEEFKSVPEFLLSNSNKINTDESYKFYNDAMRFINSDIANMSDIDSKIVNSVWQVLNNEYLNKDGQSKFSVKEIEHSQFKVKFQNNIEKILKQNKVFDVLSPLSNTLYENLLTKSKNKEFYDFFIDISNRCDKLLLSNLDRIGYTIIDTEGLRNFDMSLSWEDIEKLINKNYAYSKTPETCVLDLEWKVKSINVNTHYENLQMLFDIKSHYPENIRFPLDPQTLRENSLAKEVFSKGYGKAFISDLENSYGQQQLSVVTINNKYFFYSMQNPIKGIDILKYLHLDYKEELSCLENCLNEIKHDLFIDVEQWIQTDHSEKYDLKNEREQMKNMKIILEDECKKINSELIKQNILSQPLELQALKDLLETLRNDTKLKKDVRTWFRSLEDCETDIEDFLLNNDNDTLLKLYLNYCCEQSIISPMIFKLILQRNKIDISVYDKLDTPTFELKVIEKYSYQNNECKNKLQFWLNDETFSPIETKDIEDDKILEKLASNSAAVAYLQTPRNEIHLKTEYNISNITDILLQSYAKYEQINRALLEEIRRNICIIKNGSNDANMFVLHRIIGEKPLPTKKEILCLLKSIDKIDEWNPFIVNHKNILYEKIECYLVQHILIQQIKRIVLLISKYKSLDSTDDKDERERVLETIFTNILMERSYDKKEYPSWLLFETENNLLIRSTQCSLLKTMMEEADNSIYQLNMGEGKTSVILIIFSEMLADGKQIARINCLEPLMGVMQELLRNKFSGLLQKKIYVMPFSRGVIFSIENLQKIKEMLSDCQNGKHILLVTPEQRLCFQLKKQEMFLEYLQSKDANDFFDWNEYYRRTRYFITNPNALFDLTEHQKILKQTLQSLGYINSTDKIVKLPSEHMESFYKEVYNKNNENLYHHISHAYRILRDQSIQLKTQRKQKLELLYLIDEFKFFDILDESDEILRHGKELNYTLGLPKPLDGGPTRWEIPFLLFKIIFYEKTFGETLKNASKRDDCPVVFQEDFKPVSGIGGGSPLVRFVKHEYFVQNIRPNLCRELCRILLLRFDEKKARINDEKGEDYGSYEDFIEGKCLFAEDKIIKLLKVKSEDMLNSFLLAKAWLSHELLYHVMSYRYRVEYGLSETKEKEIAIPFRGKDLPSENSEFSHPDIMMGFTILSYLYRGLDLKQVKDGLIKLKNDPKHDRDRLLKQLVKENEQWIYEQTRKENEPFPEWIKSFTTLDLGNENRIKKTHFYLSRNFTFIQYYLSNLTFPNDTKYYDKKLTGNAHTLAGEGKTNGFSGTDDRNDTIPESVVSKRLASQLGTNGKMLHILSRKINEKYESKIEIPGTVNFLDQVCKYAQNNKECCILIDAGAIITEMTNLDVSKYFIKKVDKRFDGVVYFSDKTNKIMVILRNEECVPLSACHIDNKKLFVYLDEVHTRGTDLKLPLTAHGIVTIGKGMNKDKLMQAVMRLRDLDFKQSIVLWGSKEISAEIAIINEINIDEIISKHVLTWVTYNTIQKNENDLYLVMKEKLKYVIKSRALEYQKKIKEVPMDSLIIAYVSESVDSIEKAYGTTPQERNPRDILNRNMGAYLTEFYPLLKSELEKKGQPKELIKEIDTNENDVDRPKMKRMLENVDKKLPKSILTINADMGSDQENEREIEEMQRIEIVPALQKAPPHEVMWYFDRVFEENFQVKAFRGESNLPKLKELKKCFEFTDIDGLKKLKWQSKVFATENFIKTIAEIDDKNQQCQNYYLKPVNMILVHRTDKDVCFIIVSTFEAQHLVKLCHERKDPKVCLVHIDDINGPTMAPINAEIVKADEINNIVAIIRLFNGDCHYNNQEINVIKKCVGIVERDRFHQNKAISEEIYSELESRHYLTKGFITYKLANKLGVESEKILVEIEAKLSIDLQSRFYLIIKESIAEDAENVWKLPGLIRQLIQIRGKTIQYERSILKEILDKNQT
ncbi:unnamed protein product [Rotaria magnacalcarata]|uniref:ubiquitinyl hydrolase 1 n=1 Tax=Rotaria magnacalcarata TaxID=392030 RepID=A0A819G1I0_9BILA|nr:unnamed protein product [Rotaria magnacalcarata]CAF3878176.1 unnamed protein product [Rotaria magnacalcarata]